MRLGCSWWKRTRAQSKSRKRGDQTALKELHGQPQRLGRDLYPIRGILANQRTKLMAEFQSGRTQSGKESSKSELVPIGPMNGAQVAPLPGKQT